MTNYTKEIEGVSVDFYYRTDRDIRDIREIPTIGYSFVLNGEKRGAYTLVPDWNSKTDVENLKERVESNATDVIKLHTL